ncbi:redoxin domain-containing protein, partial [Candidatus Peregrinibacteria bacterium]|nr:redoxin domain-containing protein [Candidatus Peregrinibacteria bacterium]
IGGNYEDIILSVDFHLLDGVNDSEYVKIETDGTKKFWEDLNNVYGQIVPASVQYTFLGNQVKIRFEMEKDGVKQSFRRVLAFGNYQNQTVQPSLLVDLIEKSPLELDQKILQVGSKFPGDMILANYKDGKFGEENLTNSKNWKLLFFYPSDFTFVCPTECLALRDNFGELQKLGVDVYAVSTDLLEVHQAWETMYFGKLPYALVSDYNKQLVRMFGFWNEKEGVSYRGTVIISPDNEIKFMSAQSNDTGRNIEEYLRLIKAFQTPGLKPVNWQDGDAVIETK